MFSNVDLALIKGQTNVTLAGSAGEWLERLEIVMHIKTRPTDVTRRTLSCWLWHVLTG